MNSEIETGRIMLNKQFDKNDKERNELYNLLEHEVSDLKLQVKQESKE